VTNEGPLANLTVNGVHVLDRIDPFGNFAVQLPWSSARTSHVAVTAVDHQGVFQTSTFPAAHVRTVIRTRAGASVSAVGAYGVIVAKVRFDQKRLAAAGKLAVRITVKDRRGLLVRGAAVRLRGIPSRFLIAGATRSGFTSRLGTAAFMYSVKRSALAAKSHSYLTIVVRAATPTAGARRCATVRLATLNAS
jgi:hypothetical protein